MKHIIEMPVEDIDYSGISILRGFKRKDNS